MDLNNSDHSDTEGWTEISLTFIFVLPALSQSCTELVQDIFLFVAGRVPASGLLTISASMLFSMTTDPRIPGLRMNKTLTAIPRLAESIARHHTIVRSENGIDRSLIMVDRF